MKKALKIMAWVVGVFLALDLLLVGLLFVPAIQTFVVHKVTEKLSNAWGTEISIQKVRITPTLKLVAHEVAIKDHHDENMIYAGTVKGRLRGIKTKPFELRLGNVSFDRPDIVIRRYQGDETVNISLWAKKFKKDKKEEPAFKMKANSVEITNGRFVYINDSLRTVFETSDHPDIDYAYLELADLNIKAKDFKLVEDDVSMYFKKLAFSQYGGFQLLQGSGDFRICDTTLTFNNLKFKTSQSDLNLDLYFRYDNWYSYGEFIDSVRIAAEIRPSTLAMADIAGFAPAIRGMDEVFHLQADTVDGTVSDFLLLRVKVQWMDHNLVQGDFAIRNVIDFLNADYKVTMDSTVFHLPDLAKFTLPKGKAIPTSKFLNKVGTVIVSGTIDGDLDNLLADLSASTGIGSVKARLFTETKKGKLHLGGNVSSSNFNLARLVGDRSTFGSCNLQANIDASTASAGFTADNLKTVQAHLSGKILRFPILGYPLRDIRVNGDYQDKLYNIKLLADDPNLQCDAIAQLDNTQSVPFLQGSIDLQNFAAGTIASTLPVVDTATATGFKKVIAVLQQNPDLRLRFDQFQIALHGLNPNLCNGFLGCDNIRFNIKEDSLYNERLRLTAINSDQRHKYILSSNIANITYESSYPIACVVDSLRSILHNFLPSLIASSGQQEITSTQGSEANTSGGYIKLNVRTYNTHTLTKLFYPDLLIAPGSTAEIDIRANHVDDRAKIDLPFFGIRRKLRLHHFHLEGQTTDPTILSLDVNGDSVIVYAGKSIILFNQVNINADVANDNVIYDLAWHNPFNSEGNTSQLSGNADIGHLNDIVIHLDPSRIYLKDYECHFNDQNTIHVKPHHYEFDNLVFSTKKSSISVNGDYDTKDSSRLKMAAKNIDISLINPLLNGISFGGELSADLNLINRNNRRLLYGKAITDELAMNEIRMGDLFLIAGLNNENTIRFSGGLFNSRENQLNYEYLKNFSIKDFKNESSIVADVTGIYENKNFLVRAVFDTLQADFLEPFLSGFSDMLTGTASGDISFHSTPDSAYLDGKVRILDAQMGIAYLGTRYRAINQDIYFDSQGISFKEMQLSDVDGNMATLSGDIKHRMFKDMQLNLNIHTDRILALNTPRTTNAIFYGTGYVKGDVAIRGSNGELSFKGPEIEALDGSKIYLQINSANSASEADFIHFVSREDTVQSPVEARKEDTPTSLNFDFTFNVTKDADIVLLLDAIGGTIKATAEGRFQLLFNKNGLNLYGNLAMNSGDIKISLFDVVNSSFTLVNGGTINFNGPLEDMTVHLSAYKSSKTSLSNIIPAEYLSTGNTDVNSYIYLDGPLMRRIEPTFGFELPNSSNEVRNLFYTSIDTQNKENMTRQFAYFLVTNSFMPENMFATNSNTGIPGIGMLRNVINNVLSNIIDSKRIGFGITYNQATGNSSAEYGVKLNANLLNDRISMTTDFGYYDDRTVTNAYQNIYGNLSVEYRINQAGTWRVKAYTRIGEREDTYYYLNENFNNYVAGVALMYNQDFDSRNRNKNKKPKKAAKTSSK